LHQHHLPALDDFLDLVLPARTERPLGDLFQHVIAADGFDDFFLGVLGFVVIVFVGFIALRLQGMLVLRQDGLRFVGRFDVIGVRRVVGVGGILLRMLFMHAVVMGVFSVRFGDGFRLGGGGCRDHGRNRLRFGGLCLARMGMVVIIVAMFMIVRMVMIV
jgi:hypothetical protein